MKQILKNLFSAGFGIVGAAMIITLIFPVIIHLLFALGPVSFLLFLLIFFFVGTFIVS